MGSGDNHGQRRGEASLEVKQGGGKEGRERKKKGVGAGAAQEKGRERGGRGGGAALTFASSGHQSAEL